MEIATRTSLYRHFNAEGRLLYVGISIAHLKRLMDHREGSSWFWEIARIEIEHFDTRKNAEAAEELAVSHEKPRDNASSVFGQDRRGRRPVMTAERVMEAELLRVGGYSVNEILEALGTLPGPPISRAAYYVWQKKHDGQRSSDRKRKYRIG